MAKPEIDLDAGLAALGYESFRPGQREAVETLLERGRLLLVAPTGGGKSLTYQLPATLLPGTTLVVSPLVALMQDQVRGLEQRGVAATYLASVLDADEMRRRMAQLAQGHYQLAYVAPERLTFPGFRGLLHDLDCPLIAIDEAHCISEWGHDFRPEYMQIGETLADMPRARVLACTATATPVVRDEILGRLGLPPETPQIVRGFARPNLRLRAAEVSSKRDKTRHVDSMLSEALGEPGGGVSAGAAIVYSPTRKQAESEAARLEKEGWQAGAYHAGLPRTKRDRVAQRFASGRLEVVVATNAFGMGIDRSDVRAVVHLAPPGSVEAYYQEVGRAGRDGDPAWGLMLFSSQDMALRRRLLAMDVDGRVPDPEVVEHKWNMFLELMRWAEGGSCRHDAILRYFGDEAEVLDGCGQCDVCEAFDEDDRPDPEAVALIVRKALSGVARVHARYGLTAAAKLLKGTPDDRLARGGLDQVRTFGALSEHAEAWIVRLLRRCVSAGWVSFTAGDRPMLLLTEEGNAVMRGKRPARLLLPSTESKPRSKGSGRRRGAAAPEEELDQAAQALFERLRAHRLELARELEVPPYVIASDRSLREMAVLRPMNEDALLEVHGIGPAKLEKYGHGFLAVIAEA